MCAALGLTPGDLFDEPKASERPRVVAEYRYTDEAGELLFVVERRQPKAFRQRRPDGRGGWTRKLGDVRRVLYRFPQVLGAVAAGQRVYVVEGERDADALGALGVAATCNPGGAGKWRDSYSEALAGADVIVVVDLDEPGRQHAAAVAASLAGKARSVRIVEAASGKDVSDHLAAGRALDDLVPVDPGIGDRDLVVQSPGAKKEESTRPIPDRAMFHGVLGAVVDKLNPTTEADPVAVLVSLLAGLGVMIGSRPHLQVGNTRHPLLVWPLLFGRTSTGRKGEAWSTARRLLAAVDHEFATVNVETGLSSGEGLVERIKDVTAADDDDKKRRKTEWPGTDDKRLLVVESEFGAVMARAKREGNTLATVMREAWDGRPLGVLTKSRSRASTSHVAVMSHVTPKEFRIRRAETDLAGGSYNRFLPVFVERSKSIPIGEGIDEDELQQMAKDLRTVVKAARGVGRITLDEQAKKLWTSGLYEELIDADHEDTPAAEFTRRAAPYCLRIAGLHAVLSGRQEVDVNELDAAAALVRYSIASAHYVLQQTSGDPRLDRVRRAVADAGRAGLSRTEISGLFGRNAPAALLDELLARLLTDPTFQEFTESTGGRPSTRYRRQSGDSAELSSFFVPEKCKPTAPPGTTRCPICGDEAWLDDDGVLCLSCRSGSRRVS